MNSFLDSVCIVLVSPDDSSNIGAVCRAMKSMGITDLRIVNPKEYDENRISFVSVHAFDIYANRKEFQSLPEALAGAGIAAGTTRRKGKKRKYRTFSPEQFTSLLCGKEYEKIAVVFGNEEHGLTDEELAECTLSVYIPSSPLFPSLNLSHAVQVICYELFSASIREPAGHEHQPIAENITEDAGEIIKPDIRDINRLAAEITGCLEKAGFFRMTDDSDLRSFFRDIFSRAAVSRSEIEKTSRIFRKLSALIGKTASDRDID